MEIADNKPQATPERIRAEVALALDEERRRIAGF